MFHKYKIRQMARLVRAPVSDSRASGSGTYEVVRLMPADETGESRTGSDQVRRNVPFGSTRSEHEWFPR